MSERWVLRCQQQGQCIPTHEAGIEIRFSRIRVIALVERPALPKVTVQKVDGLLGEHAGFGLEARIF